MQFKARVRSDRVILRSMVRGPRTCPRRRGEATKKCAKCVSSNIEMKLNSTIEENFRLADIQKTALRKLGIKTVEDLLYHFPGKIRRHFADEKYRLACCRRKCRDFRKDKQT